MSNSVLSFEKLDVNDDIKKILMQYHVDFVFQPIFSKTGDVIGYEALMRPEGCDIQDFIEKMEADGKLHDLELLSFFGATLEYKNRKYDKMLSINSFPAEVFTTEEASEYSRVFRPIKEKLIVEVLEYTEEKHWTWNNKQVIINDYAGIEVALDDYGTGNNDESAVSYYKPNMVKVDRTLVHDIDKNTDMQNAMKSLVEEMHSKMIVVLAEGIETEDEYRILRNLDVDFYQGNYLGKPA